MVDVNMLMLQSIVAGAIGGAVLGVLTYFQRWKEKDESFDSKKFYQSLIPAILVGAVAGFYTQDMTISFTAGLVGKRVWEVASKPNYKKMLDDALKEKGAPKSAGK